MFENKREKARDAIVTGLQPIVSFSAMVHGRLPHGYWDDPFVLGFMYGCARQLADTAVGKQDDSERNQARTEAFDVLSDGGAQRIAQRTATMVNPRDPDFATGLAHGLTCVMYASGVKLEDQPLFARARKIGSNYTIVLGFSDAKDPQRISTAGALVHILFHEVVTQRLGS